MCVAVPLAGDQSRIRGFPDQFGYELGAWSPSASVVGRSSRADHRMIVGARSTSSPPSDSHFNVDPLLG